MPPVFAVDPLNPAVLLCRTCGETVCALDPAGPDAPPELSREQAVRLWPGLAETITRHAVLCVFKQAQREGRGAVYFHARER